MNSANTIHPLGNRVLIKRWPEVDQHESGLWLPSEAREKPQLGDVLEVGPGPWCQLRRASTRRLESHYSPPFRVQPDLSRGEVVIFEKLVSLDYQVTINGEDFLVLPYTKLYGAIQGLIR